MKYVETTKVKANLCTCKKSHQFEVSGDPDLYEHPNEENILILPLHLEEGKRLDVFSSVLVFCKCDHLTIHYPVTSGKPTWESRKTWKGWRQFNRLEWPHRMPNAEKTLRNVWKVSVGRGMFGRDIRRELYFVNIPSDHHNIHKDQRWTATYVLTTYLTCWMRRSMKREIDYQASDCAARASYHTINLNKQQELLPVLLPAVLQELYNLRHSGRSRRLEAIRLSLEKACKQAGIPFTELVNKDTGQPHIIEELAA